MYITGAVREAGSRGVDKHSCECSRLLELTGSCHLCSPACCEWLVPSSPVAGGPSLGWIDALMRPRAHALLISVPAGMFMLSSIPAYMLNTYCVSHLEMQQESSLAMLWLPR